MVRTNISYRSENVNVAGSRPCACSCRGHLSVPYLGRGIVVVVGEV